MRRATIVRLTAAAIVVLFLGVVSPQEAAGAASVINNSGCGLFLAGGFYFGSHATFVETPSGKINASCHATLLFGPGVSKPQKYSFLGGTPFGLVPCDAVETPGGQANATCHG